MAPHKPRMTTAITTIAEAKTLLQNRAAEVLMQDFKVYREAVIMDGSIDDKRKLIEMEMRLTGAEPDKKADPFANLPVFNFIINRSGDAPATGPEQVQQVDELQVEPERRKRGRPPKVRPAPPEDVTDVQEQQPLDPGDIDEPVRATRKDLTPLLVELEKVLGAEEYTEDDV